MGIICVGRSYVILIQWLFVFLILGVDLQSSSALLSRLKFISLNLVVSLTTDSNL